MKTIFKILIAISYTVLGVKFIFYSEQIQKWLLIVVGVELILISILKSLEIIKEKIDNDISKIIKASINDTPQSPE